MTLVGAVAAVAQPAQCCIVREQNLPDLPTLFCATGGGKQARRAEDAYSLRLASQRGRDGTKCMAERPDVDHGSLGPEVSVLRLSDEASVFYVECISRAAGTVCRTALLTGSST